MDWDDVRHFLTLARLGSVRAAGAALGVSHSTVARRVEALEARLAARLFDRHRDGYSLTEAGRLMLPGAERVEHEMAALERGLVGQDERLSGAVALTVCDNYVAAMLMGALAVFCESYPEIELFLNADARPFDLSKREADIALRIVAFGSSPPEHLIGQKLHPVNVASYVAVAHAARLDPETTGSRARWLSFDQRRVHEAMIAESSHPHVPAWGSFSNLELLVQTARAGLGLVMLPTYVGDADPALRRLARPDLRHVADLWLLGHPDLRDNARLRATRACIVRGLAQYGAVFRGEGRPNPAPDRPEIAPNGPEATGVAS